MAVSVRTARLLLRQWRDEDDAAFAELTADPAVMEYLLPLPGWAARKRAHWDQYGFGQWVVEIPGEASFIGVVGLETISYDAHFTPAVEVAWRLARAHWGKGYATEAARAALDTVSDNSGLTRSSRSPSPPTGVRAGSWNASAWRAQRKTISITRDFPRVR